jgi:hypothetical protein
MPGQITLAGTIRRKTMYPLLTEYLAAEHVRDMQATAKTSRRASQVRRGRHQTTAPKAAPVVTATPFVPAPREPVCAGSAASHR